jgi:hydrogenase nickel incorporation protein HypA/HybF
MHEYSLASEVIELVQREAAKNEVAAIEEIRIEVGDLSGVEPDAFEFALQILMHETLLENAVITIIRPPGRELRVVSFTGE